jgi:curved DNA-binding protein CbpA
MSNSGNSSFVDYYQLLGIHPGADSAQIRAAFIQSAKLHHPDVGGSTETMLQLNVAYKTLMSSTAKASYDLLHSFHTGSTQASAYKYNEGREVHDITDMTDEEIDKFLNTVLAEYRNQPHRPRPTMKQQIKKFFAI